MCVYRNIFNIVTMQHLIYFVGHFLAKKSTKIHIMNDRYNGMATLYNVFGMLLVLMFLMLIRYVSDCYVQKFNYNLSRCILIIIELNMIKILNITPLLWRWINSIIIVNMVITRRSFS